MSEGQHKEVGKPGQLQRIAEDWIVAEAGLQLPADDDGWVRDPVFRLASPR